MRDYYYLSQGRSCMRGKGNSWPQSGLLGSRCLNEMCRIHVDALYLSRRQSEDLPGVSQAFVNNEKSAQMHEDGALN
jgi:hypothetical protein